MNKILIIDDDKIVSKIISQTATKKLDIACQTAYTLAEAQNLLSQPDCCYELAVVDYTLPDAPSGEAIDYVVSQKIPCIVMTASYDTDIRDKMLTKPIIDYIVKRGTKELDYLISEIKRALSNKNVKALVVDDSSLYRDKIAELLKSQLINTFVAKNGIEAMQIIEQHPDIKLVITDYNMPEMDGYELLLHIRKQYKKDRMAVLIASGFVGQDVIPKFLKSGANDYISKPFNVEDFVCRVNMNLEMLNLLETLRALSQEDPLTGLYNRRFFFEAGTAVHATAIRNKIPLAVYMIDIDYFKKINDTYGHDCGDIVIKTVARLLKDKFKRKNDIVARFGGEEFCVITTYAQKELLKAFSEELREAIASSSINCKEQSIKITCSVGVCSEVNNSLEEMIKRADDYLYQAKHSGRNRVCFDGEL